MYIYYRIDNQLNYTNKLERKATFHVNIGHIDGHKWGNSFCECSTHKYPPLITLYFVTTS